MANVQIPNLTPAISATRADMVEAVQAGSSVRMTLGQIMDLASAEAVATAEAAALAAETARDEAVASVASLAGVVSDAEAAADTAATAATTASAAAVAAGADAALAVAAVAGRSNSIFGLGDAVDGLSYDVVIASPAFVGETGGPLPAVTVEVETGVIKSLLTSEAGAALVAAASARNDVETFADLATAFGYTSAGGRLAVAAGDLVRVIDIGATYRVEASGASGAHLNYTGSSGVKFTVLPGASGYDVRAFGAVDDPSTDSLSTIQAAINAARTAADDDHPVIVNLAGGNYGLSGPLFMNTASFVSLENGGLVAIGSGWTTATPIISLNGAVADDLKSCGLRSVYADCKHLCTGIRLRNTISAFLDHVHVTHAKNYHVKAEEKNTELTISVCIANQFFYGEAGFDLVANRTAYGFWVECPDTKLIGCTAYYCLEPLRGESWNIQISACHFYNGATIDGTDNVAIHLYGAHCYMITDCYIDKGILRITGGSTTGVSGDGGEFNHQITGICVGPGNTTTCVELVAVDADDTAAGLKIDLLLNGRTAASARRLSVIGSGSWLYLKSQITFRDRNGGFSAFGKMVAPDGDAAQPGLVFSSEADTNTGFYRKGANQVGFSADGVSRFFFNTSGISAETAGVGSLGTESLPFFSTYTRNLRIVDGVGDPAPSAGYAIIYVASADGDLKVKFADGTVKTIATNP